MPRYTYRATLQGHTTDDTTLMVYDLGVLADEATALANALNIRNGLDNVTSAFVSLETLTQEISSDNQLAPNVEDDTFIELAVSVHLNVPSTKKKLTTVRIPAPLEAILDANGQNGNHGNIALATYMTVLEDNAFISDNETIKTATGAGGIFSSAIRTRKKKFASKK